MKITRSLLLFLCIVASGGAAGAQQPGTPPQPRPRRPAVAPEQGMGPEMAPGMGPGMRMGGGPGMRGPGGPGGGLASELLAHTGQLKLTDQQVTRLAAIARRSADRHRSMRESMDSLMRASRPQDGTGPGAARRPMVEPPRALMDRARDQERADLRDALSVLSLDQQADAWIMRGQGGHHK